MGIFNTLFGDGYSDRARRDQWKPRVIGKNCISPVNSYGTCFTCKGTGSKPFPVAVVAGGGGWIGNVAPVAVAGIRSSNLARAARAVAGDGMVSGVPDAAVQVSSNRQFPAQNVPAAASFVRPAGPAAAPDPLPAPAANAVVQAGTAFNP
jgi:hypothetical protein